MATPVGSCSLAHHLRGALSALRFHQTPALPRPTLACTWWLFTPSISCAHRVASPQWGQQSTPRSVCTHGPLCLRKPPLAVSAWNLPRWEPHSSCTMCDALQSLWLCIRHIFCFGFVCLHVGSTCCDLGPGYLSVTIYTSFQLVM